MFFYDLVGKYLLYVPLRTSLEILKVGGGGGGDFSKANIFFKKKV